MKMSLHGAGDGRNGFTIFLACQGDAYESLPYAPRDQWESARLKQHHNTKPVSLTFVLTSVSLSTPAKGLAFIKLLYFNAEAPS